MAEKDIDINILINSQYEQIRSKRYRPSNIFKNKRTYITKFDNNIFKKKAKPT